MAYMEEICRKTIFLLSVVELLRKSCFSFRKLDENRCPFYGLLRLVPKFCLSIKNNYICIKNQFYIFFLFYIMIVWMKTGKTLYKSLFWRPWCGKISSKEGYFDGAGKIAPKRRQHSHFQHFTNEETFNNHRQKCDRLFRQCCMVFIYP